MVSLDMSAAVYEYPPPPAKWSDQIAEHDPVLAVLLLQWRCGRASYRALIPNQAPLPEEATLEGDEELDGTRLPWEHDPDLPSSGLRLKAEQTTAQFWSLAKLWASTLDIPCDFKLIGYDEGGDVLFGDGKRCRPLAQSSTSAVEDELETSHIGASRDAFRHYQSERLLEARLNAMFERHIEERDKSYAERDKSFQVAADALVSAQQTFAAVQETIEAGPRLINKASELFKDATEYQREQVERLRADSSGQTELRAKAFAEGEKTQRVAMALETGKMAFDAFMGELVPFANRVVELMAQRDLTVFPTFGSAQQAMIFLFHTLNPRQLLQLWNGNEKAAGAMRALLDKGAAFEAERDALEHIARLIPLFNSDQFRDVADAEQQLAARYIVGRLATHRMASSPEAGDDPF